MATFEWQGAEYPFVDPGRYQAVFKRWQGPEWVFLYHRWSLRLEFQLLSEDVRVSAFFNMGKDEKGPQIGRRSRYFAAWSIANGGMPTKRQEMSLETFSEPGLIYLVNVDSALIDGQNQMKPDALVYSRVTEILSVDRQ
jgi:hypothetical protein